MGDLLLLFLGGSRFGGDLGLGRRWIAAAAVRLVLPPAPSAASALGRIGVFLALMLVFALMAGWIVDDPLSGLHDRSGVRVGSWWRLTFVH